MQMKLSLLVFLAAASTISAQDTLHVVQGRVVLQARYAHTQVGDTVQLALQGIIAHSAGEVCGPTSSRCSVGDVVLTSQDALSFDFRLQVTNNALATSAVANLQHAARTGHVLVARLQAMGFVDLTGIDLRDLAIKALTPSSEPSTEPVPPATTEDAPTADTDQKDVYGSSMTHLLNVFGSPITLALAFAFFLLLIALVVRKARHSAHERLQESTAHVAHVVITTADSTVPPKYEPVTKDETSKEQV